MQKDDSHGFGKLAERFIAEKYIKNGYQILARNWYHHPAEIDIIAQKDDLLIFVEVKARSSNDFINPEEAVNAKKKSLIVRAANAYIEEKDLDLECRFDIAVVLKKPDGLASKVFVDAFAPHEL